MEDIFLIGYEMMVALLPFWVVLFIKRNNQTKKGVDFLSYHFLAVIAFSVYIVGVYHFTGTGTIYDGIRYQLELRLEQFNLIPFSNEIDVVAYLLNTLLFVPLGLLVPIIWQKMNKLTNIIGIGFLFTLLIETSQLLNNRRTDVDDIIMNVLGAIIGFGLYKLGKKYVKIKIPISSPSVSESIICILIVFVGRFLFFNEMGLAKLLYGF